MTTTIKFQETDGFKKDFRKLYKKFKTLNDDIKIVKKTTMVLFHLNDIDNQSVVLIPGFSHTEYQIYKLRKFACRTLKGKGARSGIRIIYAYAPKRNVITFLEMYFKADQASEDKTRIKNFLTEEECCV